MFAETTGQNPSVSHSAQIARRPRMNMSGRSRALILGIMLGIPLIFSGSALAADNNSGTNNTGDSSMTLEQKWDKTFPQSDKVNHQKVTFQNRYGITLAADLYIPKQNSGKMAAIAVSGPFGAVKEQASGLYAQTMAERGFLTRPSIPPSPEKAAVSRAMWPLQTSIRKISAPPWTI